MPRPLLVGQERLANVGEDDRFLVLERLDGRVAAGATARPHAKEERQWLDVRVERLSHPRQPRAGGQARATSSRRSSLHRSRVPSGISSTSSGASLATKPASWLT